PMTHDLIKNVLEAVDAKVEKIVVNDLRENTFFALIHLRMGEEEITVDSRPSDAIALALRAGAPIFVDDDVVRRAKTVQTAPKEAEDREKLKEWLETLTPEHSGRYKMYPVRRPCAFGSVFSRTTTSRCSAVCPPPWRQSGRASGRSATRS